MSDERIELTEVQSILDDMTTPTDEEFMQALRGYSDTGVSLAAAKRGLGGGGGGGSLPDWWTVDSTPGAEEVEFAGHVLISPLTTSGAGPDALRIDTPELPGDTTDVFTIFSIDANDHILHVDSGGSIEYQLLETGSIGWSIFEKDPGGWPLLRINGDPGRAGKAALEVGSDAQEQLLFGNGGFRLANLNSAPADGDLVAGQFSLWFDDTDDEAVPMYKGKSADGTVVSGMAGLPAWWTVDSTPGSEEVDFAGEVHITPTATNLYGLLIQPQAGFYDNYNAFFRVIDENGARVFNIDSGGFDMTSPTGEGDIHVAFSETDTPRSARYSSRRMDVSNDAGGPLAAISAEEGIRLWDATPLQDPGFASVQMYYDGTAGAPKVKFRCKDVNGDPFDAEIALT